MNSPLVVTVFEAALGLPPGDREVFVREQCTGQPEAAEEVLSLLGALENAGAFLSSPVPQPPHADLPAVSGRIGSIVGHYRLLELIGEGGFGSVYMAEQSHPIRRRVALKILKPGMDSRSIVGRFEAERQALAMMDHPNIAKVLDAGTTSPEQGSVPYFIMELVRGVPITTYCDEATLSPRERIELLVPVCRAVQHAHQKGIIHRDLKPSNVLVTLHDGKPVPKVIDFGIAKATAGTLTDRTVFTEFRQLIGTPAYMSPEQAEMSGLDIDTRSDVYSLGVLLYELLTGSTPFDAQELIRVGLVEMQRLIREAEPPKPSTRVSTAGNRLSVIASKRATPPDKLGRLVRGELDWIVMKAMEKERGRRYVTAEALAVDLGRHLEGEPVSAAPPGAMYRVRKFVRRHRAAALAATAVLLTLVAGLAAASIGFYKAAQDRDRATLAEVEQSRLRILSDAARAEALHAAEEAREAQRVEAAARSAAAAQAATSEALLNFSDVVIGAANPDVTSTANTTASEMLQRAALRAGEFFKDQPESELAVRTRIGRALWALRELDGAIAQFHRADELARQLPGLGARERFQLYWPYACVNQTQGFDARTGPYRRFKIAARDLISARDPEAWRIIDSMRGTGVIWSQLNEPLAHTIAGEIEDVIRTRLRIGTPEADAAIAMLYFWGSEAGWRLELANDPDAYSRVAVDCYERAQRLLLETRPESNSDVALVRLRRVESLRDMKDYPRALAAAEEWSEAARKVLPPGHWMLGLIDSHRGVISFRLGRFAEAVALLEPAIPVVETVPGLRELANNFAERAAQAYVQLGRMDDAARWETRAADWCIEHASDPRTPAVVRRIFAGELRPIGEAMIRTDELLEAQSPEAGAAFLSVIDLATRLCKPENPVAGVVYIWGLWRTGAYESGRTSPGVTPSILNALDEFLLDLSRHVREARSAHIGILAYHVGFHRCIDAAKSSDPSAMLTSAEEPLRESSRRISEFDPEIPYLQMVHSWLGRCLYLQGRHQEALDAMGDCMTAIGEESGFGSIYAAHALARRVSCLESLQRNAEARQVIMSYMKHEGALGIPPINLRAAVGALLRGGGQSREELDLAITLGRAAVKAEPDAATSRAALVLALSRGGLEQEARAAEQELFSKESLEKLSPSALNGVVWTLVEHPGVDAALAARAADALEPVSNANPKNAAIRNTLAVAQFRAGRLDNAEQLARERLGSLASNGYSTDPTLGDHALLAMVLFARARTQEAAAVLNAISPEMLGGAPGEDDQGLLAEARAVLTASPPR